jgi:hypothetical protein
MPKRRMKRIGEIPRIVSSVLRYLADIVETFHFYGRYTNRILMGLTYGQEKNQVFNFIN